MVTKQRMKAVYDCTADEPGEISFKEGDILVDVEESNEEGWYMGRIENTNIKGLFPFNYVVAISSDSNESSKTVTPKSVPKADTLSSFPTLDAFEAVMAKTNKTKPLSNSWTPLVPALSNKPPAVAAKPNFTSSNSNKKDDTENVIGLGIKPISTIEKPVLKPITNNQDLSPSRARSFSASAVQNNDPNQVLKPSQLKGAKSALEIALSKGSPKLPSNLRTNTFPKQANTNSTNTNGIALVGMSNAKVTNSNINDVDEDEGFQILKPSQLKRKQQQQLPTPLKAKPTVTSLSNTSTNINKPILTSKKSDSSSTKLDSVASNNPMPRLPSRPTSTASRKSRNSRSSSTLNNKSPSPTTTEKPSSASSEEKAVPPVLKPKPIVPSHPELPPRPKARSSSNPPPIQPKPTMSSIEILLSRANNNHEKSSPPKSLNELATSNSTTTPPPVATKKTHLQSKPQVSPHKPNIIKPQQPGLPARLNTKRSLENHRSEDANIKPSTLLRARSATNPTDWASPTVSKTVVENGNETKKVPPPPPPSRTPKKHRYEILFESIHDDGYVDGETAQFIWVKSKLSNEDLARIWRECDPDHKGLLDKMAFVEGMTKIDDLLSLKQQSV